MRSTPPPYFEVEQNVFPGVFANFRLVYDNEITSLIDIYFLRISFIPSDPFLYFIYVTYSTDK